MFEVYVSAARRDPPGREEDRAVQNRAVGQAEEHPEPAGPDRLQHRGDSGPDAPRPMTSPARRTARSGSEPSPKNDLITLHLNISDYKKSFFFICELFSFIIVTFLLLVV